MIKKRILAVSIISCLLLSSCLIDKGSSDFVQNEDNTEKDNKQGGSSTGDNKETKVFKITFIVDGESIVKDVEENRMPDFGSTPTKESTDQYEYTFVKWEPALVAATQDTTYTAQFDRKTRDYSITFIVDGNETKKAFAYGSMPDFGSTPTKASTAQYEYIFTGWDPSLYAVNKNETYTAQFESKVREYKITFDVEGTKTEKTFAYGSMPDFGSTPTKASTSEYDYVFVRWEPEITTVTKDDTYTAIFEEKKNTCAITFIIDGKETTKYFSIGSMPDFGSTPTKASTAEYDYTFSKWEPSLATATKDTSYTAVFTSKKREYSITFVVDGKDTTKKFAYGTTPSYGSTPTKASTAEYQYTFTGWKPAIYAVNKNETYTAQFESKVREYQITFVVEGNKTTKTFAYGSMPDFGSTPTKASTEKWDYKFSSWYPTLSTVKSDRTYEANFSAILRKFVIKFKMLDQEVQSDSWEYGKLPEYKGDLIDSNNIVTLNGKKYQFKGWVPEIEAVTKEQTYTAVLTEKEESSATIYYAWGNSSSVFYTKVLEGEKFEVYRLVDGEFVVDKRYSNTRVSGNTILYSFVREEGMLPTTYSKDRFPEKDYIFDPKYPPVLYYYSGGGMYSGSYKSYTVYTKVNTGSGVDFWNANMVKQDSNGKWYLDGDRSGVGSFNNGSFYIQSIECKPNSTYNKINN